LVAQRLGLPLFIVHGTKDLPIENSGILIDAYEKMHYSVEHEHPELGHNVWQTTYENLKGAKWLMDRSRARDPHPRRVRFRTVRLRDGKSYWVRVNELTAPDVWGQVDARVTSRSKITAATSGAAEIAFDRDTTLLDEKQPTTVIVDAQTLSFSRERSDRDAQGRRDVVGGSVEARRNVEARRDHGTHPRRLPRAAMFVWAPPIPSKRAPTKRSHAHGLRSAAACRCGIRS